MTLRHSLCWPVSTGVLLTFLGFSAGIPARAETSPGGDPVKGKTVFQQNCAICHGSSKGDASPSPVAKGLYQKPPQFATHGVEDDPEGVSFWKIKHGIRLTGMPSFALTLSDTQVWTIALFLKHMDALPPAALQAWERVQNVPPTTSTKGES